jgi:UDP-N-acetylglucosamine--N-acetylmuramyl-(pentapeptide) pyrophosphoryl-undecaprenol N-acetylglucosamine transferase
VSMGSGPVVLAAGGTGGHLFPAEALATALAERGIVVHLATDERATRYGKDFPAAAVHEIASATPSGRSPGARARAALVLGKGTLAAWSLFGRLRPCVVVGFGGYPTVPPVLAAALRGIPTLIHEQNGVIGRANRLLAPRARVIATGFATVRGLDAAWAGKQVHTGNPVRPPVLAAAAVPFDPPDATGTLRLVVFGGSQGARVMSDVVPVALEILPAAARARIALVQQCREEDLERVGEIYGRLGIEAELAPFFTDMPARLAAAHLVVARSGASTVTELAVIGRPSILVPYGSSLDGDQAANAAALAASGAATVIAEREFTPERLAGELSRRLAEPERLTAAARAARGAAYPDAALRLADVVIRVAGLAHQTETTP